MSDYSKLTDFASKDALVTGDPEKTALGVDVDAEFVLVATMSATKEDKANKNAASGYCGLDASALVPVARLPATVSYTDAAETFTAGKGTTAVVLTDEATVTIDADLGNVFTLTLGDDRILGLPDNPKDGQTISLYIIQDGTGSRTLTWNAAFLFAGGTAPTLSTPAASVDLFTMQYRAATSKWHVVTSGIAFS